MDISLLKQGDQPPHPPVPLLNMIAAKDQEVPATDAEEDGCKLDDEVAGIHEHRTPWYAHTNSHDSWGRWQRSSVPPLPALDF